MWQFLSGLFDLAPTNPEDREARGMEKVTGWLQLVLALIMLGIAVAVGIDYLS